MKLAVGQIESIVVEYYQISGRICQLIYPILFFSPTTYVQLARSNLLHTAARLHRW